MGDYRPEATVREAVTSIDWPFALAFFCGLPAAALARDGVYPALAGASLGLSIVLLLVFMQWWWGPI